MTQKYALITGASSGIGYAMTEALSKRGYKVFACAPEFAVKDMAPLAKDHGAVTFGCDITNPQDIAKAVKLVEKHTEGGKLDVLYNNAGIAIGGPCIEYDEQELNRIFQVNVIGQINMTKHFADMVIARKGTILFTCSIASFLPLSWTGAYSATKAAINAYAKTLRMEMAPFGVKVYSVITGGVDTHIADSQAKAGFDRNSRYCVDGAEESVDTTVRMTKMYSEDPRVYAKGIAAKIDSRRDYGLNLYKGSKAITTYWLYKIFPLWLIYFGIAFRFRQLKVFKNIRRAIAKKKSD